jgi:hypothetical protein
VRVSWTSVSAILRRMFRLALLDHVPHVIYLSSRMEFRVTTAQIGKASYTLARMVLLALPFLLLVQLIGQPEFDDQNPLFGARSVSATVFKQEHSFKSGLTNVLQLSLAVGSRLFTPGFYLLFVRIARQQEFVRAPLVSLRSSRSPPRIAGAA